LKDEVMAGVSFEGRCQAEIRAVHRRNNLPAGVVGAKGFANLGEAR
jgi:hypothetical protein